MEDNEVAKIEGHVVFYEVTVDQRLLYKCHFTSNEIYRSITYHNRKAKSKGKQKKDFVQNHKYSTIIEAENPVLAKDKFEKRKQEFISSLEEFGLAETYGEIIYLVNSVIEFECNLEGELAVNEYALNTLNFISRVLALYNQDGLSLVVRKKVNDKSKTLITMGNTYQAIISKTIANLAQTVFEEFKANEHFLPSNIYFDIKAIKQITLDEVSSLKKKIVSIPKQTNLENLTLATVAKFLQKFLKHGSPMKSEAFLTNDQARVIYLICDYYALINKTEHATDYDRINYIKAILKNRSAIA